MQTSSLRAVCGPWGVSSSKALREHKESFGGPWGPWTEVPSWPPFPLSIYPSGTSPRPALAHRTLGHMGGVRSHLCRGAGVSPGAAEHYFSLDCCACFYSFWGNQGIGESCEVPNHAPIWSKDAFGVLHWIQELCSTPKAPHSKRLQPNAIFKPGIKHKFHPVMYLP